MTMPHLMNCAHSEAGWCLDCVKRLWEESADLCDALVEIKGQSLAAIGQDTWLEVQDRLLGLADIATKALGKIRE